MNKQNKITLWALYITTFLIPFYFFRFDISVIGTNIFELFVLLSFVLTLTSSKPKKVDSKIMIFSSLLLIAAVISTIIAPDKTKALGILKGWLVVPMVYSYCVYRVMDRTSIYKIIIPLYASLLLISLWAILQHFGVVHELFYQVGDASFSGYFLEKRAFGPFESPNYLAMFLVPVTFLSLTIWKAIKRSSGKVLFLISLLLPIIALYFSASRGGMVALLAGFFIFMFSHQWFRKPAKNKLISFLFVILGILIVNFAIGYYRQSKLSHEGGDNIRREIYSYSISMIKENPVLGIGLGNFQNKIDSISKDNGAFQLYGIPFALHPHNLYFALWLNLGGLGIVSFVILLIYLLIKIFTIEDNHQKALLLAALSAILIHGLVDTTYFKNDLSAIFWLMIAITFIFKNEKNA